MQRESRRERRGRGRGPQPLTSDAPPPSLGSTQRKSPSASSSFTIRASYIGERSGPFTGGRQAPGGKGIKPAAPGAPGWPSG